MKGYGRFWAGGFLARDHRVAYEHFILPVVGDNVVHHVCQNRSCVNPFHELYEETGHYPTN